MTFASYETNISDLTGFGQPPAPTKIRRSFGPVWKLKGESGFQ
jgi:hypothetical protein